MRHILITGGAGYIGSHIVLDLIESGYQPVVIDNLSTGDRRLVPDGVPLVVGDIADMDLVRHSVAAHEIRDVIHCAGSLNVEESIADPLKYWRNNVGASVALVEACLAAGVRNMLYSSTAAVYGDTEIQPVAETTQTRPISPYGTTKRAVEILLDDVCRNADFHATALRYFNVAGADPRGRAGASRAARPSLIRTVCQALIGERDGVSIFGDDFATRDGTAVRDYIHVSDLARAHTAMLDLPAGPAGSGLRIFNCGYGHGATVREVVEAAQRVSGTSLAVHRAPRRPGDIAVMVADSSNLRRQSTWRPAYDDLDRIIDDTLRWERRLLAS